MKKVIITLMILACGFTVYFLARKTCANEPETPLEAQMRWWNEKDENGVSNAERMAESRREHERRVDERKKKAEVAAIEREALVMAKAAQKLLDLISRPYKCPVCGVEDE